jgi:hypothetical protein
MPYNHSIKAPVASGTAYTGRADGIFSLNEQVLLKAAGLWATAIAAPSAPTSVTAAYNFSTNQATITFTAPGSNGSPITSYTVTSSGGQTATGTSSPIVMSGLPTGPAYTFTVVASSAIGNSSASAQSNSVMTTIPVGQQAYTTPGDYSWIAPAGVTSVSVVAVGQGGSPSGNGGGGGGGGGLGWKNNITVVPGQSYTVAVTLNGDSYFISAATVRGGVGSASAYYPGGGTQYGGAGGTFTGDGGGNGGAGGSGQWSYCGGGGGGTGGYSGNGGQGGVGYYSGGSGGSAGSGGGGGGGGGANGNALGYSGSGGGGVGILGQGVSGAAGIIGGGYGGSAPTPGGGGSGGYQGSNGSTGGSVNNPNIGRYGGGGGGPGGGGGDVYQHGGFGAVRIIWPGNTRSFPSTNTVDM